MLRVMAGGKLGVAGQDGEYAGRRRTSSKVSAFSLNRMANLMTQKRIIRRPPTGRPRLHGRMRRDCQPTASSLTIAGAYGGLAMNLAHALRLLAVSIVALAGAMPRRRSGPGAMRLAGWCTRTNRHRSPFPPRTSFASPGWWPHVPERPLKRRSKSRLNEGAVGIHPPCHTAGTRRSRTARSTRAAPAATGRGGEEGGRRRGTQGARQPRIASVCAATCAPWKRVRIARIDAAGKQGILDDAARTAERERTRAQIEQQCREQERAQLLSPLSRPGARRRTATLTRRRFLRVDSSAAGRISTRSPSCSASLSARRWLNTPTCIDTRPFRYRVADAAGLDRRADRGRAAAAARARRRAPPQVDDAYAEHRRVSGSHRALRRGG